jgi:hypothetical protein
MILLHFSAAIVLVSACVQVAHGDRHDNFINRLKIDVSSKAVILE